MEIPPLWRAPSSGISRGRCGPCPLHLPSLPAWTAGFAGAIPAAAYRTRCRISSPTGGSAITWSSHRGPLLSLASRFQTLFAARHFRQEPAGVKRKNGVILLTGAEQGTEAAPIQTALTILKHLHVERPCTTVCSLTTNRLPAARDERALSAARQAAERLNRLYRGRQG